MTAASQGDPTEAPGARWAATLTVLSMAHAVGAMTFPAVAAMGPFISQDLALSATQFGLLVAAYSATQSIFGLPIGGIIDRIGVRRALMLAMLLVATGSALMSLANAFSVAIAAMALTGFGYGFVNPATSKGVFDWFPRERRGTAMGIKQSGVPLGGILGAGVGALAALLEWHRLLWVIVGCALLAGTACASLPSWPRGAKRAARFGMLSDIRAVLADRNLTVFNLATGIYQAGQFNFFAYITLFMREALHSSQPLAAACLAIGQGASAIGRLSWGVVSDYLFRGWRKPVLVIIGSTGALALVMMSALLPGRGVWLGVMLAVVIGLTVPGYVALVQTIVVEAAEPRLAATAVGYNRIFTAAGATLGPPIFGATVDLTRGYASGWLLTGAIVLAATLLIGLFFRERASGPYRNATQ
jgi:ACS family hexuronate transporter-like MFS transporter